MPFISQESVEEVRQRVSLVEIASSYTRMKRSGSSWVGLSPFNEEKTPSFHIWEDKGIFKCFSTNQAGNVFTFIQLMENLNFVEAIENLAEKYGITLKYESGGANAQEISLRKELFNLHSFVAEAFHKAFHAQNEEGAFARQYFFEERKFSPQIASDYRIGWAPCDVTWLPKLLIKQKFSPQCIEKSGLFFKKGTEWGCKFQGRLMIPIRDIQGRICAFTARQTAKTPRDTPSGEAKYVNSPETPIFHKGNLLFNLCEARKHIKEDEAFVLVEGQLDAIRCHEQGIQTAVAPQGTAITSQQIQLMRRYANQIYCLLDSDKAGQKAALRLVSLAFAEGVAVEFVAVPAGEDPDTFFLRGGKEAWETLVTQKESTMRFVTRSYFPEGISGISPAEVERGLHEIYQMIAVCRSEMLCKMYLQEVADLLRLDVTDISRDFENRLKRERRQETPSAAEKQSASTVSKELTSVEQTLSYILLHFTDLQEIIVKHLEIDWITTNTTDGVVLRKILAEMREGLWSGEDQADTLWDNDGERAAFFAVRSGSFEWEEPLKVVDESIRAIFHTHFTKLLTNVSSQIAQASSDQTISIEPLFERKIELKKILQTPPSILEH